MCLNDGAPEPKIVGMSFFLFGNVLLSTARTRGFSTRCGFSHSPTGFGRGNRVLYRVTSFTNKGVRRHQRVFVRVYEGPRTLGSVRECPGTSAISRKRRQCLASARDIWREPVNARLEHPRKTNMKAPVSAHKRWGAPANVRERPRHLASAGDI